MPKRTDRTSALQVLLTIVAVAAGGLLLLIVVLAATGSRMFVIPQPAMDPAMAGLAVGKAAPEIKAEAWVNGEPETLDGKVVVVQGWFYDCPYCWKEAPEIARLHEKYGDRVAFVGLSTDRTEDADKVKEFVSENGLKYPVGYGYDSHVTLGRGFEATAFPAIWVVGRNGAVVWNLASQGERSLEEAIEAALAGPSA